MEAAARAVTAVTPGISVNVGMGEEVKMSSNMGGVQLHIDTDAANMDVPVPPPAPVPGHTEMNVDMNIGGMMGGMNMEVTESHATYHSETKVNGVTTSETHVSSTGVPPPVGATSSVGMMGMGGTATAGEGGATAQVSIPGGGTVQANANINDF